MTQVARDIVVVGAGAIGTLVAHFATAGHRVAVIDRARRTCQIRQDGLRVYRDGAEARATVTAYDDLAAAPTADFVFLRSMHS